MLYALFSINSVLGPRRFVRNGNRRTVKDEQQQRPRARVQNIYIYTSHDIIIGSAAITRARRFQTKLIIKKNIYKKRPAHMADRRRRYNVMRPIRRSKKYRCVLLIYVRLMIFIRRRTGPGTILSCGGRRARVLYIYMRAARAKTAPTRSHSQRCRPTQRYDNIRDACAAVDIIIIILCNNIHTPVRDDWLVSRRDIHISPLEISRDNIIL